MCDLISRADKLPSFPVPIPGLRGEVTAKALNGDYALGPAVFRERSVNYISAVGFGVSLVFFH